MRLRVEVTAEDIKRGRRNNRCRCPVARACRRAGLTGAEVGAWSIVWGVRGGIANSMATPPRAARFVNLFDGSGRASVKPFVFRVKVPKSAVRR